MISVKCKGENHTACKGSVKYRKKAEENVYPQPIHTADCECDCHSVIAPKVIAEEASQALQSLKAEAKQAIEEAKAEAPKTDTPITSMGPIHEKPIVLKAKIGATVYQKGDAVKIAGLPGAFTIHYFAKEPKDGMITVTGWDIGRGQWRTLDAKKIKRVCKPSEIPRDAYATAMANIERADKKKRKVVR